MRLKPMLRPLFVTCAISLLGTISLAAGDHVGQISIEHPPKDSLVTTSTIVVRGSLINQSRDIGVTVNGVRGVIDVEHEGTKQDPFRWSAEIGVSPGKSKIKARLVRQGAENSSGQDDENEAAASVVHVECVPPTAPTHLRALPSSGLAPVTVSFSVETDLDLSRVTRFEIDYQGDGTYDLVEPSVPETATFQFLTAGLYHPIVRITTPDGSFLEAQTGVVVHNFRAIDTLLRRRWTTLVDAMVRGDVAGALQSFAAGNTRDKYESILQLIRPSLPQFASRILDLKPIWINGDAAHYLLVRVEDGKTMGYHVYFARDANGLWKIVQM